MNSNTFEGFYDYLSFIKVLFCENLLDFYERIFEMFPCILLKFKLSDALLHVKYLI